MEQSNLFSLNWRDFFNGLIMAILTPVVYIVQASLDAGTITFNWTGIGIAALSGAVAYIVKNFFTPKKKEY